MQFGKLVCTLPRALRTKFKIICELESTNMNHKIETLIKDYVSTIDITNSIKGVDLAHDDEKRIAANG